MERDIAAGIVEALKKSPRRTDEISVFRWQEKAFHDSWLSLGDIEDLLTDFDDRLWRIGVREVAEKHELTIVHLYDRPKSYTSRLRGVGGLPIADLVALLIIFECLGFEVDPSAWVTRLLPTLKGKKRVTNSELNAIWYSKTKHKMKPLNLFPPKPDPRLPLYEQDEFHTTTGHKVCAYVTPSGEVIGVTITPPKYRKKQPPQETVCPDCGFTWLRGDTESSHAHRSFHKREMRIRAPEPDPNLLGALDAEVSPEEVLPHSPQWKHDLVYAYAFRFRREFGYDFDQWHQTKRDEGAVAYVFADDTGRFGKGAPIGGCAFRLRGSTWTLDWIWVIPALRRQGILTRRWERFRQRFGEFDLEYPLSDAMEAFATRHAPWLDAP